MNCNKCGAWSSVVETRANKMGLTRRRRECANQHRFWTLEVYMPMVNIGAVKRAFHTILKTRTLWTRDETIRNDQRTAREIAKDHGLALKTIHSIKRKK